MLKKINKILCFLLLFSIIFNCSCKQVNPLYDAVSELRCQLYTASNDDYKLDACYGFIETPYNNDAKVRQKVYSLSFRLHDKESDYAEYSICFNHGDKTYSQNFKLNPVSHTVSARVEIDNFNEKSFTVTIKKAQDSQTLTLNSIVPDNAIDYRTALDKLKENQADLIKAYTDQDGNFNAEIRARIIVKDNRPYWYVGIASNNNNLKALLIDGFTGQTLAIREIF